LSDCHRSVFTQYRGQFLVGDATVAAVIQAAAGEQVAVVGADGVEADEGSAGVVDALLREDGDVVAAGDEEGTAGAVEVVPHGVPRVGLVEGTVLGADATMVGVPEEVAIVLEAEVVTLTVGISDGHGSDVSALEVEIAPDGCLAVTKVKGVETNIRLQVHVDVSLGAAGAGAVVTAAVAVALGLNLCVLGGRGDGGEAEEGGNERRPDLHSALAVVFTRPRIGCPGLL